MICVLFSDFRQMRNENMYLNTEANSWILLSSYNDIINVVALIFVCMKQFDSSNVYFYYANSNKRNTEHSGWQSHTINQDREP